jgi:CRP-like cAMP-binding protein
VTTPLSLWTHPFLADLESSYRPLIEGLAAPMQYPVGGRLLSQNSEVRHCHLLCEGRVILETCDTRAVCHSIQTLEAGAVIGWSWLQPPHQSFFDARALTPVTTIALDAAALRAAMEADHEFGYAILKRVVRPLMSRLQACRLQLVDVYAHPDPRSRT